MLRQLDGRAADRARRAVDQDLALLERLREPQAPQRVEAPVGDGGRLLEGQTGRHGRDPGVPPDTYELRVGTEPEAGGPEDPVADGEVVHGRAQRLDLAGKLAPEDRLARPAHAGDEPADERDERAASPVGIAGGAVAARHGCGADPDPELVLCGFGLRDVLDVQYVRRAVPVVDDRFHKPTFSGGSPSTSVRLKTRYNSSRCRFVSGENEAASTWSTTS